MTTNDFIFARYIGTSPVNVLFDKSLKFVGFSPNYFHFVSVEYIILVLYV